MGGLFTVPSAINEGNGYNERVCGQSRTDASDDRMMGGATSAADTIKYYLHSNQNGGDSINNNAATRLSPFCVTWADLSSLKVILAGLSASLIPTATIGMIYYVSHQQWKQQLLLKLHEEEQIKQHLLDINETLDQQELMVHELQQQVLLLNRRSRGQYDQNLLQRYLRRQRDILGQQRTTICSCHHHENNKVSAAVEEETVQAVEEVTKEEKERDDEENPIITSVDHDGLTVTSNEEERNGHMIHVMVTSDVDEDDDDDEDKDVSDIQTTPIVQVAMKSQAQWTPPIHQVPVVPLSPLSPPSLWSTTATSTTMNERSTSLPFVRTPPVVPTSVAAAFVSPEQRTIVDEWSSSSMQCCSPCISFTDNATYKRSTTTPKYMPFLQPDSKIYTSNQMMKPLQRQEYYHSIQQQVDSRDDDDDEEEQEQLEIMSPMKVMKRCPTAEEEDQHENEETKQPPTSIEQVSRARTESVTMMRRSSTRQEAVADQHYKIKDNEEEAGQEQQQQQQLTVVEVVEESLKNQRHQTTAGQPQYKRAKQHKRYSPPDERKKGRGDSNYTTVVTPPPTIIRSSNRIIQTIRTPKRNVCHTKTMSGGWNSNTSQFFTPPSSGRRTNILSPGSTINEKDLQRWKNSLRT